MDTKGTKRIVCIIEEGDVLSLLEPLAPSRTVLNMEVSVREVQIYIYVAKFRYFLFVYGG